MKKIILIMTMFIGASAYSGQDGGGGHACKLKATSLLQKMDAELMENAELRKDIPEWDSLKSVVNPLQNPKFEFLIVENPISNCRNTENALACAVPKDNTITLNCGDTGLGNVTDDVFLIHLLHELYWFTGNDDSNYYKSESVVRKLMNLIASQKLTQGSVVTIPDSVIEAHFALRHITIGVNGVGLPKIYGYSTEVNKLLIDDPHWVSTRPSVYAHYLTHPNEIAYGVDKEMLLKILEIVEKNKLLPGLAPGQTEDDAAGSIKFYGDLSWIWKNKFGSVDNKDKREDFEFSLTTNYNLSQYISDNPNVRLPMRYLVNKNGITGSHDFVADVNIETKIKKVESYSTSNIDSCKYTARKYFSNFKTEADSHFFEATKTISGIEKYSFMSHTYEKNGCL